MRETHPFQADEDRLRGGFESLLKGARLQPMDGLSYSIISTHLVAVSRVLLEVSQRESAMRG